MDKIIETYTIDEVAEALKLHPYTVRRICSRGEDEWFCHASRYLNARKNVPGVIDWLKEKAGIKTIPKVGRNEQSPCGSGKKHKKCCGI